MDVDWWSAGTDSCCSFSSMAAVLSWAPSCLSRRDGAPLTLEAARGCGRAELDHSGITLGVPSQSQARDAASKLRQCTCDDHCPLPSVSLPRGKRKVGRIADESKSSGCWLIAGALPPRSGNRGHAAGGAGSHGTNFVVQRQRSCWTVVCSNDCWGRVGGVFHRDVSPNQCYGMVGAAPL